MRAPSDSLSRVTRLATKNPVASFTSESIWRQGPSSQQYTVQLHSDRNYHTRHQCVVDYFPQVCARLASNVYIYDPGVSDVLHTDLERFCKWKVTANKGMYVNFTHPCMHE